jgi:predicted nucleotidyltransferase
METTNIEYTNEGWQILKELREEALLMMHPLTEAHIHCIVYGSLARGDVKRTSDIDIFIPSIYSSNIIEAILSRNGRQFISRQIIQATPSYAAKAYLFISESRGYSFPLVDLKVNEIEFYKFAGSNTYQQLKKGLRVSGVDKRLMFIEPTEKGHLETPVKGNEGRVAKMLGINLFTIRDRVRALNRREKVGRTGVYLKRELSPEEAFGEVFVQLSRSRPAIRRRMRSV